MTDDAAADPTGADPATVGFALLMADVEAAVAAASAEIAILGQIVQQGTGQRPEVTPPVQRSPSPRPAAAAPGMPDAVAASLPCRTESLLPAPSVSRVTVVGPAAAVLPVAPAVPPPLASTAIPSLQREEQPISSAPLPRLPRVQMPSGLPAVSGADSKPGATEPSVAPVPSLPSLAAAPTAERPLPRAPSPFPISLAPSAAGESEPDAMPASAVAPAEVDALPTVHSRAPTGANQAPLAPRQLLARSMAPNGRPAAQDATERMTGTAMHGDVFLDGLLVGHWMTEALAKAAGGPARGSTAFDTRMGPRWPGALQGQ